MRHSMVGAHNGAGCAGACGWLGLHLYVLAVCTYRRAYVSYYVRTVPCLTASMYVCMYAHTYVPNYLHNNNIIIASVCERESVREMRAFFFLREVRELSKTLVPECHIFCTSVGTFDDRHFR